MRSVHHFGIYLTTPPITGGGGVSLEEKNAMSLSNFFSEPSLNPKILLG